MRKFNVRKFILSVIIIIGVVIDCSLYFGYLNKRIIKEKETLQATHKEEVQRLKEVNEKHVQTLVQYETKLEDKIIEVNTLTRENDELREIVKISRGENSEWERFRISFYDLSVTSCGKKKSHPEYGLTASGFNLKGLDWETARTIATDPKIIPTGSEVMIKFFDERYEFLNGIYTARDRGSVIKNYRIDIFYGEDAYKECMDLGITYAYVQVLK